MKLERQRDKLMELLNDVAVPRPYKKAVRWALSVIDSLILDCQQRDAAIKAKDYEIKQLDFTQMVAAKQADAALQAAERTEEQFQKFLGTVNEYLVSWPEWKRTQGN